MNFNELIASGLLELYCYNLATKEEIEIIELVAATDKRVLDEIIIIKQKKSGITNNSILKPNKKTKEKLFETLYKQEAAALNLPSLITPETQMQEWQDYILKNNIEIPAFFENIFVIDLPSNINLKSYIACAKKDAFISEVHEQESERILMIQGTCIITMHHQLKEYSEGDYIEIPCNTWHVAQSNYEGTMILIGQRFAI